MTAGMTGIFNHANLSQHVRPSLPLDLQLQILLSLIPTERTFHISFPDALVGDTGDVNAAVAAAESEPDHHPVFPIRPRPSLPTPAEHGYNTPATSYRPRMYQPTTRLQPHSILSILLVHPALTPYLLQHLYSTSGNIFHFSSFALILHFHRTIPSSMIPLIRRISIDACGPPLTVKFTVREPTPHHASISTGTQARYLTQCFDHVHPDLHKIPYFFTGLEELRLPGVRPYIIRHAWDAIPDEDPNTTYAPATWTSPYRYEITDGTIIEVCDWRSDMIRFLADLVSGHSDHDTRTPKSESEGQSEGHSDTDQTPLHSGRVLCARRRGTRILRRRHPAEMSDQRQHAHAVRSYEHRQDDEYEVDVVNELRESRELYDYLRSLRQQGTKFVNW